MGQAVQRCWHCWPIDLTFSRMGLDHGQEIDFILHAILEWPTARAVCAYSSGLLIEKDSESRLSSERECCDQFVINWWCLPQACSRLCAPCPFIGYPMSKQCNKPVQHDSFLLKLLSSLQILTYTQNMHAHTHKYTYNISLANTSYLLEISRASKFLYFPTSESLP